MYKRKKKMEDPKGEGGPLTKLSNFFSNLTDDAKKAIENVKDAVTGAPATGPSPSAGGSKRRRRLLKKSAKKSAKKKAKKNKKK